MKTIITIILLSIPTGCMCICERLHEHSNGTTNDLFLTSGQLRIATQNLR